VINEFFEIDETNPVIGSSANCGSKIGSLVPAELQQLIDHLNEPDDLP